MKIRLLLATAAALSAATLLYIRWDRSWRPEPVFSLPFYKAVAFSSDGHWIAGAEGTNVILKNLQTGQSIKPLTLASEGAPEIQRITFSNDGQTLALVWCSRGKGAGWKMGVVTWGLKRGQKDLGILNGLPPIEPANQIRFSPDSKTLWVASADRVRAWSAETGKKVTEWQAWNKQGRRYLPAVSALSPDCRTFTVASNGEYTRWDTQTGKRLCRFEFPIPQGEIPNFSENEPLVTYRQPAAGWAVSGAKDLNLLWVTRVEPLLISHGEVLLRGANETIEVRDARNATIERRISRVSDAIRLYSTGNLLYTLDNTGRLYRQRLR